jgi:thioredoxin-like negative regulator of GroEL
VLPEDLPYEAGPPGALQPEGPQPGLPGTEAQQAFEAAFRLFLSGNWADALAGFQTLAAADPQNGEALLGIVQSAFALGRYADAARALEAAAALGAFPKGYRFDPRPLYPVRADAAGAGQSSPFDALLQRLQQHVRVQRQDADAHLLLAYLHVAMGRTAEANLELAWHRALRPGDPTAAALATALEPAPQGD